MLGVRACQPIACSGPVLLQVLCWGLPPLIAAGALGVAGTSLGNPWFILAAVALAGAVLLWALRRRHPGVSGGMEDCCLPVRQQEACRYRSRPPPGRGRTLPARRSSAPWSQARRNYLRRRPGASAARLSSRPAAPAGPATTSVRWPHGAVPSVWRSRRVRSWARPSQAARLRRMKSTRSAATSPQSR